MKKITSHGLEIMATDGLANRNLELHLYTNDFTPGNDGTFVEGDFTELDIAGYASETLESTAWEFSTDDRAGYPIIVATQPQVDFTFTDSTAATIRGWYAVSTDGTVAWAERLSPDASFPSGSGTLSINPRHVFGVEEE